MYRFLAYLRYYLYCVNEHSLHSPLIYDLYRKVIKPSKKFPVDEKIESIRNKLVNVNREIDVVDLGMGKNRPPRRKISDIAKNSLSPSTTSVLLSELIEYFEAKQVLELGTSLGLNTLYMSGGEGVEVTTFEGSETIAGMARENFGNFHDRYIRLIVGDLDETLQEYLSKSPKLDFVFFDANHAYEPTMSYYTLCRNKIHDESVFVFDDIHHSKDMEKAWDTIRHKVEVTMSIDLFHLGIVLFDPSLKKQDYVLQY